MNSTDVVVAVLQLHIFDYYHQVLKKQQQHKQEENPYAVVRVLWHSAFEPMSPVAQRIQQTMTKLELEPGQYISTHIRALYRNDQATKQKLLHLAVNAAHQLLRSTSTSTSASTAALPPMFIVSDSSLATLLAVKYGQEQYSNPRRVVGRSINNNQTTEVQQPLHLEKGLNFLKQRTGDADHRPSSDSYDAFVDLYILANSQCVAYGARGYGKLGGLLSYSQYGLCLQGICQEVKSLCVCRKAHRCQE